MKKLGRLPEGYPSRHRARVPVTMSPIFHTSPASHKRVSNLPQWHGVKTHLHCRQSRDK